MPNSVIEAQITLQEEEAKELERIYQIYKDTPVMFFVDDRTFIEKEIAKCEMIYHLTWMKIDKLMSEQYDRYTKTTP